VTEIPANPNLPPSTVEEFALRRKRNREAMGGVERIARTHRAGLMTARERIAALLDRDSFREIGTFAASSDPAEQDTMPADGRIAGFGRIAPGGRSGSSPTMPRSREPRRAQSISARPIAYTSSR
jgi:acetyl-CoA carboxylase carboxyltransferase component